MTDAEALEFAQEALAAWGANSLPRLIKNRENAVFEAMTADGTRAALRLHRPGYQSAQAIRSELVWSLALARAGLDVPVPVPTTSGDYLAEVPKAGRVASLVSWSEGEQLGDGGMPLCWPAEQQAKLYQALGRELARLHNASDSIALPRDFVRPVLDAQALLGENPAWGRFWENPSLTSEERQTLLETRSRLSGIIHDHARDGDLGLIHADALRENVLVDGDRVKLIDFDDGVFGFRMYELGVAMSQNTGLANSRELSQALLRGYGQDRPLPDAAPHLLEVFTTMRGLASCGWVIGRYAPDHPDTRAYAMRALHMARRFLSDISLFDA